MQNAETILNIIRDRGTWKLPLEGLYRQLFNPDLYLRGYGRIYSNDGAMTKGITEETPDGMSMDKINGIIEKIRYERYVWTPVRRVEIPKKNGKKRPLGIPTWSDKLLQEVMRSLMEAYYEPQFSDYSHGFRPKRGCHTALPEIQGKWKGIGWFIEGDIKGCFDNIDHTVLMSILRENIHDNRFLRLIENLLKAGYMKDWKYNATLSGTPQGGIISPLLSNIYLDRLDRFVTDKLLPDYRRGDKRAENPEYSTLVKRAWYCKKTGKLDEARELEKKFQTMPSKLTKDPDYRQLRYIRYADDFLLGFAGPKTEAEEIKNKLKAFLFDTLKLELSEEKTLITHARTERARFLSYEIATQSCDTKHDHRGQRIVNGGIGLRVPADIVETKCALYMANGKAIHRKELEKESDFDIVTTYQSEYRGVVQYYLLAINVSWLGKLRWIMETSLLKTLAAKHQSSVARMSAKYAAKMMTPYGPRKCFEVIVTREGKKELRTHFGGIPLRRRNKAFIQDLDMTRHKPHQTELIKRLLADECEICKRTKDVTRIEVHHVRKLADLNVKGRREKPLWMQIMATRRRKTLVVCLECHDDIHAGRPLNYVDRT